MSINHVHVTEVRGHVTLSVSGLRRYFRSIMVDLCPCTAAFHCDYNIGSNLAFNEVLRHNVDGFCH